jgi:hypothetical protein
MSHTVSTNVPSTTVAPGGSSQFVVMISSAPDPVVEATISVEFAGETVTAPFTINTSDVPEVTIDGGTSGLSFAVGQPARNGATAWSVPVTVTST